MKKIIVPIIIGGVFMLALAVMIATTIALKKEFTLEATRIEGRYTNRVGADYVGSRKCKQCHERRYLEWKTSLHSRAMQDAKENPLAIIGDFESPSQVRTFKIEDVAYTMGSQWKQEYIKKNRDDFVVLPAKYVVSTSEWEPLYADDPKKRSWFTKCAGCHVTGLDLNEKKFVETGVACEACHGPGGNHVEAVKGYEIQTIIHPVRLTAAATAQLCGSCHIQGHAKSEELAYPGRYQEVRGVANLKLYYDQADPKTSPELFWPSGDSKFGNQQYIDWQKSQHRKVGVNCITCHSVHASKYQEKTRLFEDQLCRSCHSTMAYRSVHRIHTFGSCVACHMPTVATIATPGDARSHTFTFIPPESSIKAGGLDSQPNACSSCHHHNKTKLEDLALFLEAAKKADMPKPFTVHLRPGEQYETKP